MNAFDIIESKGQYFNGSSLHYLIGLDENDSQVCEIDGESYCSTCIDKVVAERNEELKRIGYSSFINTHDCSSDEVFVKVGYATESSPEKDDFEFCENCGAEIDVGVLFTYSDEIEYWIEEISHKDFDIEVISEEHAYRIYTCLTSLDAKEKHPNKVNQLRTLIDRLNLLTQN